MLTAGNVLGDRYRLEERIASGGMGEVWRATDTVLGRGVAVKMLDTRRREDSGFQSRFRHEAQAMAMLHHPGVADVYDYGQTAENDDAYIVMAFIDGQPLNERIAEAGRLDPAETMSIVAQAARALQAAHAAGIVHRDVKPGNLIIKPDGTVVLVDFGVARSAGSATLTGVNEVVGTALYIAPEQVSKHTVGPATDIYALGAVAYHCLAGHPPFMGANPLAVAMSHLSDDPPALPADVPQPVRDLVTRAMAKEPDDRFPSAAALADAATAALGAGATADLSAAGLGAAGLGAAGLGAAGAAAAAGGAGAAGDTAVMAAAGGDPTVAVPAAVGDVDSPTGGRSSRRTAAAWAGVLLALVVAGIAFALLRPDWLTPGPSNPPASPQVVPSGSAGADQGDDQGGDQGGDQGDDDATTGPTGGPGATPATGGENPANPTAPATDGAEPTGPAEEEPTEPAPDSTAEPAPTATANPEALPTPVTTEPADLPG
jgi:eukaryotic-like serine/threonine-protein kinase